MFDAVDSVWFVNSVTEPVPALNTGASFVPVTVIVTVAVALPPFPSSTV